MGAYTLGADREAIEENRRRVFALFPRLEERRDQLGGTLSGGEQQMLCIGCALMARPRRCEGLSTPLSTVVYAARPPRVGIADGSVDISRNRKQLRPATDSRARRHGS
jgi:hypothetical protein